MGRGMPIGRVVAAPHVPALQADAQVQPGIACKQALLATVHSLGKLLDQNMVQMCAGGHDN